MVILYELDDGGNKQGAIMETKNQLLVEKNVGGTEVQTTEAKLAEEKAEAKEEYDARKTKREVEEEQYLLHKVVLGGNFVLGKPSLLGA